MNVSTPSQMPSTTAAASLNDNPKSDVAAHLNLLVAQLADNKDNSMSTSPRVDPTKKPLKISRPMNVDNHPARQRPDRALPTFPTPPIVNHVSEPLQAKYVEAQENSGVFHIDGEKKIFDENDFVRTKLLGTGTCGTVWKMMHKQTNLTLAVKIMQRTSSIEENKRIIMDLNVLLKVNNYEYIVDCLGYFIRSTEVWICMEPMASCFGKLLQIPNISIPESVVGKVAFSVITALNYLKVNHDIIHRDVKPSNILIDERGNIKLCDFGISSVLINSIVKSNHNGCVAYKSPECINTNGSLQPVYDSRADIWSVGISAIELATGEYPYGKCANEFELMIRIVGDDPPKLPRDRLFSEDFRSFVDLCLTKDYLQRPKYTALMKHQFFIKPHDSKDTIAKWYQDISKSITEK